jgi:hypothetical protein
MSQSVTLEFCPRDCEDRTWADEAEESPLLEAVAREQLVEDTAGQKRFSKRCGGLWIVEISSGAVIARSSGSYVWVVNRSIHQSKPHL